METLLDCWNEVGGMLVVLVGLVVAAKIVEANQLRKRKHK